MIEIVLIIWMIAIIVENLPFDLCVPSILSVLVVFFIRLLNLDDEHDRFLGIK